MKKVPVRGTCAYWQKESTGIGIVANTVANVITALLMCQLSTMHVEFMTQFSIILLNDLKSRLMAQKFWGRFFVWESTGEGTDFELIPTVKMETRHPVELAFDNEFSLIYNHC